MKSTSKHIVFIATRLDLPGGIEKAIITTANLLTEKGYKITLLVTDVTKSCFYEVNGKIKFSQLEVDFGINSKAGTLINKIKMIIDILAFKKWFKNANPDIVIATEYHLAIGSVLAALHKKCKTYSWEHHHRFSLKKSRFWKQVIQMCYPKLTGIICLNDEEKQLFSSLNSNVVTIPNFIPIQNQNRPVQKSESKKLLTVARLSFTKGIDILIEVAKKVFNANGNVKWKIIGDGEAMPFLQQFIKDNNLSEQLTIEAPISNDLSKEYRSTDIYVLTSRYECFPMTLLEAMSFSVPCISFDCDTGPRHIIRNQVNGLLAAKENINQMANQILELLANDEYRNQLGKQAYIDSISFSPERIYLLWERFFSTN